MSASRPLHLQLWSYNYDPEPTGIAPVSTLWARELRLRGHRVEVVAAHPHYPEPRWGRRVLPYREERDGIPVLRLPLAIGRATTAARLRQELSFATAQLAALPALGRPDAMVVVSPSFPALLPALLNARARRLPWLLWLQDILPDGALAADLVSEGPVLRASRRLERKAYSEADRVVVISRSFAANLRAKGVPESKLELIYNPATGEGPPAGTARSPASPPRVLSMGNIGRTQGLAPLVAAFERSRAVEEAGAVLAITGGGVAAADVEREVKSKRVEMLGLVDRARLESELGRASLALVSQLHGGTEFNLPSKLMTFMAHGLPILAVVDPASECARLVEEAGAGWVVDSSDPAAFPAAVADLLRQPRELDARGDAARRHAQANFSPGAFAARFEAVASAVVDEGRSTGRLDSARLVDRLRAVPGAQRAFRRLTRGFDEGSVVEIRRGPASGLRWARHHRYVNGYWLGVYELPLQEVLVRELGRGDCFWDVGANAGFFSLLAAKVVGRTGHVKAFDPLPENVESIRRQFELNPIAEVEVVAAAVADRSGTADLVLTENTSTPHLGAAENGGVRGSLPVRTVTLDSIPGPRPALVKVDVEGAELAVLEGARELLAAGTKWLIELHDHPQSADVEPLLEDAGYAIQRPPGLGADHILAVPRGPRARAALP